MTLPVNLNPRKAMNKITMISLTTAALISLGASTVSAKPYSGSQHPDRVQVSGNNWSIAWSWGEPMRRHYAPACPPQRVHYDYFEQGQRAGYQSAVRDQRHGVRYHIGKRHGMAQAQQSVYRYALSHRERNEYLRGFRHGYASAWR